MSELNFLRHRPDNSIHDLEITDCVSNKKSEPCVLFEIEMEECGITEFALSISEIRELYVLLDRHESGETIE